MALAFYVDVLTFVFAALHGAHARQAAEARPRPTEPEDEARVDLAKTFDELKEGWHYIFINHTVRAVNLGLATGLIGGGMLIPLGAVFSTEVLGAGAGGLRPVHHRARLRRGHRCRRRLGPAEAAAEGAGVHRRRCSSPGAALFVGASSSSLPVATAARVRDGRVRRAGLRAGLRAAAGGGRRRAAGPGLQLAQHAGAAVRARLDGRRPAARGRCSAGCPSRCGAARSRSAVEHRRARRAPHALAGAR